MTKWMLLLLYWFHTDRRHGPFKDWDVIRHMEDWSGWVPHAPKPHKGELGSPSSRHVMIDNLMKMGLVERVNPNLLQISERGNEFLLLLHPDCLDMDLPWRVVRWENAWSASRESIERYIRTVFGKQNRFRKRHR